MAVEKAIPLPSGGAVLLLLESVNLFSLTDVERALLDDIAQAIRKYERRLVAEGGNGGNPAGGKTDPEVG